MKKGLVIKTTGSWYAVEDEKEQIYNCKIRGNLRIKGIKSTSPLAVGDWVDFTEIEEPSGASEYPTGWIHSVKERKNYIIRRSPNLSKQSHIIAANIDQAVLVVTLAWPVTTTTFIDRYLASAEAYRIPVLITFNKEDLYTGQQKEKLNELLTIYTAIGYECLITSAQTGKGLDKFKQSIKDKKNVINGHSGVGKSTLINSIEPAMNLKTSTISKTHKTGKHTTALSALYKLSLGGYIIDTPGIKGFGMLEMEPWEISHYFREIFNYSKSCQYNNCSHTHEPGCAVKKAVQDNKIAKSRFLSYLDLLEGDDKYRKPY